MQACIHELKGKMIDLTAIYKIYMWIALIIYIVTCTQLWPNDSSHTQELEEVHGNTNSQKGTQVQIALLLGMITFYLFIN